MTTNDKTGEKLLASMRKTKAAATGKAAAPKGERPAPQNEASQARPRKKSPGTAEPRRAVDHGADPYQSGRRVWPD